LTFDFLEQVYAQLKKHVNAKKQERQNYTNEVIPKLTI